MTARDCGNSEIVVTDSGRESLVFFGSLADVRHWVHPERTVVLTDRVVRTYVPAIFPAEQVVEVPRGEAAKNLACLESVYQRFLELEVGRDWTVLGIGGGSVSDLAGFAASSWLRGVDFGFCPTTVLAMVDASVGGKNGIDFHGYKNLIGSFSLPRFVLADVGTLTTLPPGDVALGLVESVKHAVIEGAEHLALLEEVIPPRNKDKPFAAPGDPRSLIPALRRSIELKARIASLDPREAGDRRKLNLGHTIGHAVEAVTGLPHGACVAVGLAAALRLAVSKGGSGPDAERVLGLLGRLGVPCALEEARAMTGMRAGEFRKSVVQALSVDKKRVGDTLLFALPLALGDVRVEPLELREIEDFVREAP